MNTNKKMDKKKIEKCFQPLVDHFQKEHGIALPIHDIYKLTTMIEEANENLIEIWRVVCDVKGCNLTAVNQGGIWRESGYWCLCAKHAQRGRSGKSKPIMKKTAVEREKKRGPDGVLKYNTT